MEPMRGGLRPEGRSRAARLSIRDGSGLEEWRLNEEVSEERRPDGRDAIGSAPESVHDRW